MLKVGCPVSGFFQLVLGIPPKLTPNAVNKSLGTSEVFSEESLKLRSRDGSGTFMASLVLDPSEADGTTEESGGKGDTIHPSSA